MTGRPHLAVAAGRCSGLGGLGAGRACAVVRRGQGGLAGPFYVHARKRGEGSGLHAEGKGWVLPFFFFVSFPFLIFLKTFVTFVS